MRLPRDHGGPVDLPTAVEELLVEVAADGFTLHCCGPKTAPNALVGSYEWAHYIDVLTIRNFDRVITARLPKRGDRIDIFAPEVVVWAYEGPPQQAIRALLDLVHPDHPDAPTTDYPAPVSLHVPRAQQCPMTIRPPSPARATVRAARLTTAMTPHSGDRDATVSVGAPDPRLAAG
ncbi:MAG: hypothetical protein ACRDTD_27195 [Pseudonocardiaceae bacterium]